MKISKSTYTSYKKALTLFELILSISLFAIVAIGTLSLQTNILKEDIRTRELEILKLEATNTKLYLQKNLQNLENLKYEENKLYYKNTLLLENLTNLTKKQDEKFFYIELFLDESIKTNIVIKR